MAVYGGFNYTNFGGVNLKNTAGIRVESEGFAGTLAVKNAMDAARQWFFPNKSGTFPIMGTFAVQLPASTANQFSTIATVSGIRVEDGLVVINNNPTGYETSTTAYILLAATPGQGQITLWFHNLGQGTGYVEKVFSYVAVR